MIMSRLRTTALAGDLTVQTPVVPLTTSNDMSMSGSM